MPAKRRKSRAATASLKARLQAAGVQTLRQLVKHDWEPSASESREEDYYDIDEDASCDEERDLMPWDFFMRREVGTAEDSKRDKTGSKRGPYKKDSDRTQRRRM
jgi:hypothetical protein